MKTGVLFGESETTDEDKKLNRITVSLDDETYKFIEDIANVKNVSHSEIVKRICVEMKDRTLKQAKIIVENPIAVSFDLLTK